MQLNYICMCGTEGSSCGCLLVTVKVFASAL